MDAADITWDDLVSTSQEFVWVMIVSLGKVHIFKLDRDSGEYELVDPEDLEEVE